MRIARQAIVWPRAEDGILGDMSQENVELVRSSIEAYIAGDRDAYLDFFAEDVEAFPDASRFPEAEPFRGREEFRRFLADIDEGWERGCECGGQGTLPRGRPGRGSG